MALPWLPGGVAASVLLCVVTLVVAFAVARFLSSKEAGTVQATPEASADARQKRQPKAEAKTLPIPAAARAPTADGSSSRKLLSSPTPDSSGPGKAHLVALSPCSAGGSSPGGGTDSEVEGGAGGLSFEAVLERQEGQPWGFAWNVAALSAQRLLVAGVDPGSPAGGWNASQKESGLRAIGRGDEVVGVNGAMEYSEIRRELAVASATGACLTFLTAPTGAAASESAGSSPSPGIRAGMARRRLEAASAAERESPQKKDESAAKPPSFSDVSPSESPTERKPTSPTAPSDRSTPTSSAQGRSTPTTSSVLGSIGRTEPVSVKNTFIDIRDEEEYQDFRFSKSDPTPMINWHRDAPREQRGMSPYTPGCLGGVDLSSAIRGNSDLNSSGEWGSAKSLSGGGHEDSHGKSLSGGSDSLARRAESDRKKHLRGVKESSAENLHDPRLVDHGDLGGQDGQNQTLEQQEQREQVQKEQQLQKEQAKREEEQEFENRRQQQELQQRQQHELQQRQHQELQQQQEQELQQQQQQDFQQRQQQELQQRQHQELQQRQEQELQQRQQQELQQQQQQEFQQRQQQEFQQRQQQELQQRQQQELQQRQQQEFQQRQQPYLLQTAQDSPQIQQQQQRQQQQQPPHPAAASVSPLPPRPVQGPQPVSTVGPLPPGALPPGPVIAAPVEQLVQPRQPPPASGASPAGAYQDQQSDGDTGSSEPGGMERRKPTRRGGRRARHRKMAALARLDPSEVPPPAAAEAQAADDAEEAKPEPVRRGGRPPKNSEAVAPSWSSTSGPTAFSSPPVTFNLGLHQDAEEDGGMVKLIGKRVLIQGLVRAPEFNGQWGRVESFDPEMQRYLVNVLLCGASQPVMAKLRRDNLVVPPTLTLQFDDVAAAVAPPVAPPPIIPRVPTPPPPTSSGCSVPWCAEPAFIEFSSGSKSAGGPPQRSVEPGPAADFEDSVGAAMMFPRVGHPLLEPGVRPAFAGHRLSELDPLPAASQLWAAQGTAADFEDSFIGALPQTPQRSSRSMAGRSMGFGREEGENEGPSDSPGRRPLQPRTDWAFGPSADFEDSVGGLLFPSTPVRVPGPRTPMRSPAGASGGISLGPDGKESGEELAATVVRQAAQHLAECTVWGQGPAADFEDSVAGMLLNSSPKVRSLMARSFDSPPGSRPPAISSSLSPPSAAGSSEALASVLGLSGSTGEGDESSWKPSLRLPRPLHVATD